MAEKSNLGPEYRCPLNGAGVQRISCSTSIDMNSESIQLETWNDHGLGVPGKVENLIKELKRLNIPLIGISKTHRPGAGRFIVDS